MNAGRDQTELRSVELDTGDGVMRGKVAVTTGPMRLAGLVATALQLTDALVDRATKLEVLNNRAISCKPGCGACCRQMVPLSAPEAFALMDVMASLPQPSRDEIRARFEAASGVLEAQNMIEELLDPPSTIEPVLPIARRYFGLGLACPFLEEESCSIHSHRPTACRDYNVTSPPLWCERPYEHDIAKVALPIPLSVPLARAAASAAYIRPQLVPLTLVPGWVQDHAELGRRTWPGPELFDLFLEEVAATYRA